MFTIGEVSARTGVHIETIRYYERIGLVPNAARAENGRRIYDDQAMARLAFIRRARDLGFPVADISALFAVAESNAACCDAHALATRHRNAIRAKIVELRRLERLVSGAIERCTLKPSAQCPVIQALTGHVS